MRGPIVFLLVAGWLGAARGDETPPAPAAVFDFTRPEAAGRWQAAHDIGQWRTTPEGLEIQVVGDDPYLIGPPHDYPPGVPLLLRAKVWSEQGGSWQVFYSDREAVEPQSVRFDTRAGAWQEVALALPALGRRYRLRLDPPGGAGGVWTARVARLTLTPRAVLVPPAWRTPGAPDVEADSPRVTAGSVTLRHDRDRWGAFVVDVDGERMAAGHTRPLIGYLKAGRPVWFDVAERARVDVHSESGRITATATLTDPDGARWTLRQTFAPASDGAVAVTGEATVDADRDVVFLPLVQVHPGLGSFGARKTQGLLAGVEYLDDEPSSSEADVEGPAAVRLVPPAEHLTFPLAAVQAKGRYVGLVWDRAPGVAALFDSPDRTFGSGAHVFGLVAAGVRVNGGLFPLEPEKLAAGKPQRASALLIGGRGESVVPAVQHYVALRGLPPRPALPARGDYVRLAAAGWLDTPIRDGANFRHALAGAPGPAHHAADAAWMLARLAAVEPKGPDAPRLRDAAAQAAEAVRPEGAYHALVSHLRAPVWPLVYGQADAFMAEARRTAGAALAWVEPSGAIPYRPAPGQADYARTNPNREASGFAGRVVSDALRAAAVAGDPALLDRALGSLRALDRFRNAVPRGAQTWEVPLHTPDVLASAHLVHAYALAFELTGEKAWLDAARYWAWTGVPFVYLVNPTDQPIGPYATTPVLGATNWVAPVWVGRPVQWCGLVYADALFDLARLDPEGPWSRLAEGITASGVQQTYPASHPHRGLLPDSFVPAAQSRVPADINPGTLEPLALRVLGSGPSYSFRAWRQTGLRVHAPGALTVDDDAPGRAGFTVEAWPAGPSFVLVQGLKSAPRVTVNGRAVAPDSFLLDTGTLVVRVQGRSAVRVETDPR